MKLTIAQINLFKGVLAYTGETEINPEGNEIPTGRKLMGEEMSQRRHFKKNISEVLEKYNEKFQEVVKDHNKLVGDKKELLKDKLKKEEKDKKKLNEKIEEELRKDKDVLDSLQKVKPEVKKLDEVKYEIEITDKTKEVIKKYFSAYETTVGGWEEKAEDEVIEIQELLA